MRVEISHEYFKFKSFVIHASILQRTNISFNFHSLFSPVTFFSTLVRSLFSFRMSWLRMRANYTSIIIYFFTPKGKKKESKIICMYLVAYTAIKFSYTCKHVPQSISSCVLIISHFNQEAYKHTSLNDLLSASCAIFFYFPPHLTYSSLDLRSVCVVDVNILLCTKKLL